MAFYVTGIGTEVFVGCKKLTGLSFAGTVEQWKQIASVMKVTAFSEPLLQWCVVTVDVFKRSTYLLKNLENGEKPKEESKY